MSLSIVNLSVIVIHTVYILSVIVSVCAQKLSSQHCLRHDEKHKRSRNTEKDNNDKPGSWPVKVLAQVSLPRQAWRWSLCAAVTCLNLFLLLESLRDGYTRGIYSVIEILGPSLALMGCVCHLILYDFIIERYNKPGYLISSAFYWACSVGAVTFQIIDLYKGGMTGDHPKLTLSWMIGILYAGLLAVETMMFIKMCIFREQSGYHIPRSEAAGLNYIHPFVSFISRITWHWLTPLLSSGYRKTLQMSDLGLIPNQDHAYENFTRFKKIYDNEKEKSKARGKDPSLYRCYWLFSWRPIVVSGLLKLFADQIVYVPPVCLPYIVTFVEREVQRWDKAALNATTVADEDGDVATSFWTNGFTLTVVIVVTLVLQTLAQQNSLFLSTRHGIRCKGALQAMVFDKTLRMSTSTLTSGSVSQGQVLNNISVDPIHVCMLFYYGHMAWSMSLLVLTGLGLLYMLLGLSALLGGLIILVSVPMQYAISQQLAVVQNKVLEHSDERLKKTNEMLQSIKLLKLYAWESIFRDSILATRRKETRLLLKTSFLRMLGVTICDGTPVLACLMTFCLYPYIEKQPLEAGKVFSSIAIFCVMMNALFVIIVVINTVSHAHVSTGRLEKFFLLPELEESSAILRDAHDRSEEESELKQADQLGECDVKVALVSSAGIGADDVRKPDQSACVIRWKEAECVTHDDGVVPMATTENLVIRCGEAVRNETDSETVISVRHGSFTWGTKENAVVLKDVNLDLKKGQLCFVMGPVGSGKSSLVSALLREMSTVKGSVTRIGNPQVAFVSQRTWLLNASLRENILFGRAMDTEKYQRVVQLCCLQPDLELLPAGDLTEIGEKGANLSGGQKQRVSLARAIYRDADVIMMDDPLSALDATVTAQIFTNVIQNYLLARKKTVLLVTHQVQYVERADWVVLMKDGEIEEQGHPKSMALSNIAEFVRSPDDDRDAPPSDQPLRSTRRTRYNTYHGHPHKEVDLDIQLLSGSLGLKSALSSLSVASVHSHYDEEEERMPHHHGGAGLPGVTEAPSADQAELGRLIETEDRVEGAVSWRVALRYARAATWGLVTLTLVGYTARQVMRMVQDYWLKAWTEADVEPIYRGNATSGNATDGSMAAGEYEYGMDAVTAYYLGIYGLFSAISIVLLVFGFICLELMSLSAARNLYRDMLNRLIGAPLRFFDKVPVGRILNRCSGDTNVMDEKMPMSWDQTLYCVLLCLGGVVMNAVVTPFFILPMIPVAFGYWLLQRFYIASSRELQRLDSLSKSPLLSQFSETLSGLVTIRAYRDQGRFRDQNWKNIDQHNTTFLYLNTANAWLGLRLDLLGVFIVFVSSLCSICACLYGYVTPGMVALCIAYALMTSSLLNWCVRGVSELEMWFSSVERVTHYSDIAQDVSPPDTALGVGEVWPNDGSITFDNVSLRYDVQLPPVVRNFSATIQHGQKIGICGRTGSGKSSLTLSLFNMVDICEGSVIIGGRDVKSVPLATLRSALAIIPQDPSLFEGTIRFNVNPNGGASDEEIWRAMDVSQLRETIQELPQRLDTKVTEGGENFSVGQRQLFCLARAVLRDTQILIMDEATASVDLQTDKVIQEVIQTAFKERTVITVAHRLSTIFNCDVVMVMKDGCLHECGLPQELLARDSLFAAMVKEHKF